MRADTILYLGLAVNIYRDSTPYEIKMPSQEELPEPPRISVKAESLSLSIPLAVSSREVSSGRAAERPGILSLLERRELFPRGAPLNVVMFHISKTLGRSCILNSTVETSTSQSEAPMDRTESYSSVHAY